MNEPTRKQSRQAAAALSAAVKSDPEVMKLTADAISKMRADAEAMAKPKLAEVARVRAQVLRGLPKPVVPDYAGAQLRAIEPMLKELRKAHRVALPPVEQRVAEIKRLHVPVIPRAASKEDIAELRDALIAESQRADRAQSRLVIATYVLAIETAVAVVISILLLMNG